MHSSAPPAWHWLMMNDVRRNEAFRRAIHAALLDNQEQIGSILDIGAGCGLLTLIVAAELARKDNHARFIYALETVPSIAELCRQCCNDNLPRHTGPGEEKRLHVEVLF